MGCINPWWQSVLLIIVLSIFFNFRNVRIRKNIEYAFRLLYP